MNLNLISFKLGIYMWMLLGVGIILLLSVGVLFPNLFTIYDNVQNLNLKKEQFLEIENKRKLLESITNSESQIYFEDSENALPSEKDIPSILVAFENASALSKFGLESLDLNPGSLSTVSGVVKTDEKKPKTAAKNVESVLVQVNGQGSISQFRDFLSRLTNGRRLIDFESIEIDFPKDASASLGMKASALAYFLTPVNQISAISGKLPQISDEDKKILEIINKMPVVSESSSNIQILDLPVGKSDLFAP